MALLELEADDTEAETVTVQPIEGKVWQPAHGKGLRFYDMYARE